MHTPAVISATCKYSTWPYDLPPSTMPPAITGTILHDLPRPASGGDVAQRLVGAGHGKHLAHTGGEDVTVRDHKARAAEAHDAQQPDGGVDASLGHKSEEGVLEVLAAVGFLIDVLL